MTRDEHIAAHKQLHRSFDLLIADFIRQSDGKYLTNSSLMDLAEWSFAQTLAPTLPRGVHYDEDLSDGDSCPYAGCNGRMGFKPVENCSCHLTAPCGQCENNPLVCLECSWTLGDPNHSPTLESEAPKLLEVLSRIVDAYEGVDTTHDSRISEARQLIAALKGEA